MRPIGILLLVFFTASPLSAAPRLLLGVHPYLDEHEVVRRFEPLAQYISQQTGQAVQVRVGKNYAEHIEVVGGDRVDIAYLGPSAYVRLLKRFSAKPILGRLQAAGKATFHGYIVTRTGSDVRRLEDLAGRRFAFGDRNSTMSHLVPRYMLQQAGVSVRDLASYRHYKGHNNVAMAVLSGAADAGAIKAEVLEHFRSKGLQALAETPEISEHLFVTRADLPPALVQRLRKILLDLKDSGRIAQVLAPIKKTATGIVPASGADYDNLRRIMQQVKGKDDH